MRTIPQVPLTQEDGKLIEANYLKVLSKVGEIMQEPRYTQLRRFGIADRKIITVPEFILAIVMQGMVELLKDSDKLARDALEGVMLANIKAGLIKDPAAELYAPQSRKRVMKKEFK